MFWKMVEEKGGRFFRSFVSGRASAKAGREQKSLKETVKTKPHVRLLHRRQKVPSVLLPGP